MRKMGVFIVFLLLSFSFSLEEAQAIGLFKNFAGRIVEKKATEIRVLESTGFTCTVLGKTIQIVKVGVTGYEPLSYFIPFNTLARWTTPLRIGSQIIGQYSFKTPIVCTNGTSAKTVNLSTITSFATPER